MAGAAAVPPKATFPTLLDGLYCCHVRACPLKLTRKKSSPVVLFNLATRAYADGWIYLSRLMGGDRACGSLGHSSATTRRLGCMKIMADNPMREICDRVAEVQALLHDHIDCGKHSAADVVAKAQAVLSEAELLRAMFVGYFPPNTPQNNL